MAKRKAAAKAAQAIGSQLQTNKRPKKDLATQPKLTPKIGDPCPDFQLKNDENKTVSLKGLAATRGVIIFVYPKHGTPGCTQEARAFSEQQAKLQGAGYGVVGMSGDTPEAQAKWRAKLELQYNLLVDPDHKVLSQLGATKGTKILRSYIVLEKGGKILDLKNGLGWKDCVSRVCKLVLGDQWQASAGKGEGKAVGQEAKNNGAGKGAEGAAKLSVAGSSKLGSDQAGGLTVGQQCVDFEVETDESTDLEKKTASLKDLVKDNGIVIFFYPKANTPGCTKQAQGFRDQYDRLLEKGYRVLGMSADKPAAQGKWRTKLGLQYNLLCDPSFKVLKQLGVTKGAQSIKRSHIVIGKGGVVEDIQYGVSPAESVDKAVELLLGSK